MGRRSRQDMPTEQLKRSNPKPYISKEKPEFKARGVQAMHLVGIGGGRLGRRGRQDDARRVGVVLQQPVLLFFFTTLQPRVG